MKERELWDLENKPMFKWVHINFQPVVLHPCAPWGVVCIFVLLVLGFQGSHSRDLVPGGCSQAPREPMCGVHPVSPQHREHCPAASADIHTSWKQAGQPASCQVQGTGKGSKKGRKQLRPNNQKKAAEKHYIYRDIIEIMTTDTLNLQLGPAVILRQSFWKTRINESVLLLQNPPQFSNLCLLYIYLNGEASVLLGSYFISVPVNSSPFISLCLESYYSQKCLIIPLIVFP